MYFGFGAWVACVEIRLRASGISGLQSSGFGVLPTQDVEVGVLSSLCLGGLSPDDENRCVLLRLSKLGTAC